MAYTKTVWENLPSTNTPINATNLNKIETELDLRSNIVTTTSTNSVTLSATGNQQIPITSFRNGIGDKFTISNNRVIIGAGVDYVLISANIYANLSAGRGGAFNVEIKKNGTTIVGQTNSGYASSETRNACLSIAPMLIDVAENDYIEYYIYGYSGDVIRSETANTGLTLQAV